MQSDATYECPLVGRLEYQRHDGRELVSQCVATVDHYKYDTKVMFSSVRYGEDIRIALNSGVHTITAPWKIIKALTENNFTALGTQQFYEHTRLLTTKVKDAIRPVNPLVDANTTLTEALVKMTEYGFGCVAVSNGKGRAIGVFTERDLGRKMQSAGAAFLSQKRGDFKYKEPIAITRFALLD